MAKQPEEAAPNKRLVNRTTWLQAAAKIERILSTLTPEQAKSVLTFVTQNWTPPETMKS